MTQPTRLILVADDDADMRRYLVACLERLDDVRVIAAADGGEALRQARALAPVLVISDVAMPGLDGLALVRALRADAALAATPILLLSGQRQGPESEADGFLLKPFNAATLRAGVTPFLSA